MSTDSLGDRIKRYETVYNHRLTPRSPLIIRVDGRAFHTYTKGMEKPFDRQMMYAMDTAAEYTATAMQGFKLAFVQSDEVTFLLTDYDELDTQGWFGYELNKVVSLSASIFTGWFNFCMNERSEVGDLAAFDSRAFTIPIDDVPNVFIWRQRDWERNSLQMLARSYYSSKQLHDKGHQQLHDMLHEIGVNWADLTAQEKNGTFILRDKSRVHEKTGYDQIRKWIDLD